jgi:hypothetical protein
VKLSIRKSFDDQDRQNLIDILGKIDLLIREVVSMVDNCNHLNSQREVMEKKIIEARTKSAQIKESSNNSAKLLESLHQILVVMQKVVDEIKSKSIKGLNLLSSEGTYVFKLNFSDLLNNEQSIQSESIHTSQSGYAMKLICEIYTEGQKQKRYLSISLVLLMGNFDAILSWPMNYPITLSIIDLTPAKKNIDHLIPINSRMPMFDRPINNENMPCRIQKFCTVDTLLEKKNTYIQDDFLFIQLLINFIAPGANAVPDKVLPQSMEDYINRNIVENIS